MAQFLKWAGMPIAICVGLRPTTDTMAGSRITRTLGSAYNVAKTLGIATICHVFTAVYAKIAHKLSPSATSAMPE